MGNVASSKHLAYYKQSWIVVKRIMMKIAPKWLGDDEDYYVTISRMDDADLHKIDWHVNKEDISHQYIFTLGNFEGGLTLQLRARRQNGGWKCRVSKKGSQG